MGDAVSYWTATIPLGLWLLWIAYHVAKAPCELYRELEEKMEAKIAAIDLELKTLKEDSIPLEIDAPSVSSPPMYAPGQIGIRNSHPKNAATGVCLKLLKIEPTAKGETIFPMSDSICRYEITGRILRLIKFTSREIEGNTINAGQEAHFEIFTVDRGSSTVTLRFSGAFPSGDEWIHSWNNGCDKFNPEIETEGQDDASRKFREYILTFEVSANGRKEKKCQFKLAFSLNPKEPPFQLKKL